MATDLERRVAESFARQGLMTTLGARIEAVAAGRVVLAAPIGPAVSQQQGFAHAGLAFALGDSAQGYAALTLLPDDADVLTAEMKINLVAPAAGLALRAEGTVAKAGRRLLVTRATVSAERKDGGRVEVALLQGTMVRA